MLKYTRYDEKLGLSVLANGNVAEITVNFNPLDQVRLSTLQGAIEASTMMGDMGSPRSAIASLKIQAELIAQYYDALVQGLGNVDARDVKYK